MADTWRAVGLGIAFASGKCMIDVFNASGSPRVIRIRRAYMFNNQLTAVTGVLTTIRIGRMTNATGGTTITPVPHDTNNAALPSQVTAGTGRNINELHTFRHFLWAVDEPSLGGYSMNEWELYVPFAEVWNAGYGDVNVQPITCRAGYGFYIKNQGTAAVGTADFEIEFTNEAT